eukprot:1179504-Prorocentrum_minimum.AAC.2
MCKRCTAEVLLPPRSVEEVEGAPWTETDSWLEDHLESNPHNNPLLEAVPPREGPAPAPPPT